MCLWSHGGHIGVCFFAFGPLIEVVGIKSHFVRVGQVPVLMFSSTTDDLLLWIVFCDGETKTSRPKNSGLVDPIDPALIAWPPSSSE